MNRYENLADLLERQIRDGLLVAGQRMPSIRQLSASRGLSPATVVEAYALLRERGWVESRSRSGFFVSSGPGILPLTARAPSRGPGAKPKKGRALLELDEAVFALRQASGDPRILPLGAATPLPEFFPCRALARSMRKVLAEESAIFSEYLFPPGSMNLRNELARRYSHLGVDIPAEHVTTTSGAIEAIACSLQAVLGKGDKVAVESPTYFGILQLVSSLGYEAVELPVDPRTGLAPERLEEAISSSSGRLKAAILVPNHSNPLGVRMQEEAKKAVVDIASRARVTLIENDVYGDLSHDPRRPVPIKAYDRDGTVILCGSYSKTISPSLRVGFAISEKHSKYIAHLRSAISSGTAALSEETLAVYLRDGGYDRHLQGVRKEYATLTRRFRAEIAARFPEGTRLSEPAGGYVLWIQLPGEVDSLLVQKKALERKISVAPGVLFSSGRGFRSWIRINCAVPWGPRVGRGLDQVARIVAGELAQGAR